MMRQTTRIFSLLVNLALLAGLGGSWAPPARAANLHPLLAQLAAEAPEQMVAVIVQKADASSRAEALVAERGGVVTRDLRIINAFAAELTAGAARELAASPAVRWVSLDAPMHKTTVGDLTVRDEFGVLSYNNNNGTRTWAAAWNESGDDGKPGSGSVFIANGQLQLKNKNRTLRRPVNLEGMASATLSFQYRRIGLDHANDYVAIQVSANGSSWKELARFAGPGSDNDWQTASFDFSDQLSGNTVIQFITSPSLGADDSLYVDNLQIAFVPQPPGGPDGAVNASALLSVYNQAIRADRLWALGYQGSSLTVAVVDSGIADLNDFKQSADGNGDLRIVSDAHFAAGSDDYKDWYGHGTHVAGIIGGNGNLSAGRYIGVAPKVRLVSIDVSDQDGVGTMADVVAGLQWVNDHRTTYNIRVVNISLNSSVAESYHTSPLCAAVEILWFNGVVVVTSAGNNGTATLYPPANDPFVITVGAVDDKGSATLQDDSLAAFSAYGTDEAGRVKPDLVAPGANIVSVLAKADARIAVQHPNHKVYTFSGSQDFYFRMSGTSFAAPMVSGAVALLLQDEPNLTPDQVKYRLMATANRSWTGYDAARAGAGTLDIYAAVTGTTTQSSNTGVVASQMLWTGSQPLAWGSASWNSASWNSASWNSASWNSASWNSVNWNSDYWGP